VENLITDVAGLRVGNAHDALLMSGVTVLVFDEPAIASVAVLGGAPAGRDIGCLEPEAAVERIDAIVLSGGSGYGLEAASGAQAWLRARGRGLPVGTTRVPIVPQAICFDLLNGGNKDWDRYPPYRELAFAACEVARAGSFPLGTIGGGYGASTVTYKGGLGSASAVTARGFAVGALAVVNALGSPVIGEGPHFWAAPFEEGEEFGGLGMPAHITPAMRRQRWKGGGMPATTIACVATDAVLDKAEAKRLALMAHCGLARALRLAHAPADGDTVFAVATGRRPLGDARNDLTEIGATAADCLARSIARGVYEATNPGPGWLGPPAYRDRFPRTP